MKQSLIIVLTLLSSSLFGQAPNPVTWTFSAVKKSDKVYEIHMTASIVSPWHTYSQTQPADAIAIPTNFTLNTNPLLSIDGKINEIGEMENFHNANLGISANQYSKKVDFIQKVTLKANVKTSLTGSVEYQTCDDRKCLPPKTINFTIPIS